VGFLEREGESWACFLVTYAGTGSRWHGYFSFRPKDGEEKGDEIRTADIFLETSEAEIDRKARGLGRPLLSGLLASALHTHEGSAEAPPRLRRWFRAMLAENSRELAAAGRKENGTVQQDAFARPDESGEASLSELRSLYASYRMDQVAHLIALLEPEDFQLAVDTILNGKSVDFGAKDRLQFAMMVVEHIEGLLSLPPFDVWVEDFLAHRDEYRLYAHTLHREGRLP
jgi:hypothetical protein